MVAASVERRGPSRCELASPGCKLLLHFLYLRLACEFSCFTDCGYCIDTPSCGLVFMLNQVPVFLFSRTRMAQRTEKDGLALEGMLRRCMFEKQQNCR